jgi:hypothetical protein
MISVETLPNVNYVLDDANHERWGSKKWDYIHTRMMLGAFGDFREIINRSFRHLEPGGWMESQEMWPRAMCDDGTLDPTTNKFIEWIKWQDEAAMRLGMPLRIANKLKKWYQEAGFVEVKEEVLRIPINGWPKDPRYKMLGKWWGRSLLDGLQGFTMALFTRAFNWTAEEVEVYLVEVRKAIMDRSAHAYHSLQVMFAIRARVQLTINRYVVYGRKPTEEEQRTIDERSAREATSLRDMVSDPVTEPSSSGPQPQDQAQSGPLNLRPQTATNVLSQHVVHGPSGRTSQSSNRRPKQPFSASPHPNV